MIVDTIQALVSKSMHTLFNQTISSEHFQINLTKPEFEGDYTVVLFSLVKQLRMHPDTLGEALGKHLVSENPLLFSGYTLIKGFLNLTIVDQYWIELLSSEYSNQHFGKIPSTGKKVMVEYSSPNTNKPLHLGHIRNNLLGASVAKVMSAAGYHVTKVNLVNDRGIHICKSMLAWQKDGKNETPASTGIKGDHLVGNYYVAFDKLLKAEANTLIEAALIKDFSKFNAEAVLKISAIVDRIELSVYKNYYSNYNYYMVNTPSQGIEPWNPGGSRLAISCNTTMRRRLKNTKYRRFLK